MEEFETLLDSEKAASIRTKIKNLEYLKYNIELDIIIENAISSPNENTISELNNQLKDLNLKQSALITEINKLVLN